MPEKEEEELEHIKKRLMSYKREEIVFNEPHFTLRLVLRDGRREDVINALLKPDSLVYSFEEVGRLGDTIHCLYFAVSNTRTMYLPVIFDRQGRKSLYILTYILRYRPWQRMIRRGRIK